MGQNQGGVPNPSVVLSTKSINVELIRNKYLMVRKIGQGGFGSVFLVKDKDSNGDFALKVSKFRRTDSPELLKREYELIEKCCHLSVVNVHEYFILDYDPELSRRKPNPLYKYSCFVMDYCNGGSLDDVFKRKIPIPRRLAITMFVRVLQGVRFLHENSVVHRDLKPENILVNVKTSENELVGRTGVLKRGVEVENEKVSVKITDFGVSKFVVGTNAKTVVGTLIYAAPELFSPPYDERVDVWSLGIIFLQVLSGKSTEEYLESFKTLFAIVQKQLQGIQVRSQIEMILMVIGNPEVFQKYLQIKCGIQDKEIMDVVQKMICVVSKRATTKELLDHHVVKKWIREYNIGEEVIPPVSRPSPRRKEPYRESIRSRLKYDEPHVGRLLVEDFKVQLTSPSFEPSYLHVMKSKIFENYGPEMEKLLFANGIPQLILQLDFDKFMYTQLSFLHLMFLKGKNIVFRVVIFALLVKNEYFKRIDLITKSSMESIFQFSQSGSGRSTTRQSTTSSSFLRTRKVTENECPSPTLDGKRLNEKEERVLYIRMIDKVLDIALIGGAIFADEMISLMPVMMIDESLRKLLMSRIFTKKVTQVVATFSRQLPSVAIAFVMVNVLKVSVLKKLKSSDKGRSPFVLEKVFTELSETVKEIRVISSSALITGGGFVSTTTRDSTSQINDIIENKVLPIVELVCDFVVDKERQRRMCESVGCCMGNVMPCGGGFCRKLYKCEVCVREGKLQSCDGICRNCVVGCHEGHHNQIIPFVSSNGKQRCMCSKQGCKIRYATKDTLGLFNLKFQSPPSLRCRFDCWSVNSKIRQERLLLGDGVVISNEPICVIRGGSSSRSSGSYTSGYYEVDMMGVGGLSLGVLVGGHLLVKWDCEKGCLEIGRVESGKSEMVELKKKIPYNCESSKSGVKQGDFFGCGVTCLKEVYFTKNGELLPPVNVSSLCPLDQNNRYNFLAIVEGKGENSAVHVNFGKRGFVFDFHSAKGSEDLGFVFPGGILALCRTGNFELLEFILSRCGNKNENLRRLCEYLLRFSKV